MIFCAYCSARGAMNSPKIKVTMASGTASLNSENSAWRVFRPATRKMVYSDWLASCENT
ncbi:hypothetical protein D3C72_2238170 [compost metagenome]